MNADADADPGDGAAVHARGRWRRSLAGLLAALAVVAAIEGASALLYRAVVPASQREAAELVLGLRTPRMNQVARYVSHPYFGFISNPEYVSESGVQPHNAWGLRGSLERLRNKPAGTRRVVAIGGSTTYGMLFAKEQNVWPALVERRLAGLPGPRVEVLNAGVPYYTSFELIGLAAMLVPEFSPDVVLIHTGLNDAFAVGFPEEGGPDNTLFRHAWRWRDPPGWLRSLMRVSKTARLVGVRIMARAGALPGDLATVIQAPTPSAAEVAANAASADGRWFRRNLRTLAALVRVAGAAPVFVTEPLNPAAEERAEPYLREVTRAVRRNNEIMKRTAAELGAPCIDVYPGMRDPALFVDAAHETKAGMEAKAALVAESLAGILGGAQERRPAE